MNTGKSRSEFEIPIRKKRAGNRLAAAAVAWGVVCALSGCVDIQAQNEKSAESKRLPVAVFDGKTSHVAIPPWKTTGKFGVFAQFSEVVPEDADSHLLVDEAGQSIALRGGMAKAQFGDQSFTAPLAQTPANGYCAIFIEQGKMTAFDGFSMTSASGPEIITTGSYSVIGMKGGDHSAMKLRSLALYDYAKPANSRCYVAQEDGSFKDVVFNGVAAQTFSLSSGVMDRPPFTPPRASSITTAAQWEEQYANAGYNRNNPCWVESPTRTTDFGEPFAWSGSYWIEIYLALHNTTANPLYLDRAIALIDFMLSQTDRARFDRGEITCADSNGVHDAYAAAPKPLRFDASGKPLDRAVPAEGWRRRSGGGGWENIVLIDGVITSGIAKYCHYVLSRPSLSSHHANAKAYLASCAKIIRAHDTTWSRTRNKDFASYYYLNDASPDWGDPGKWSGPIAFNHSLAAVTTMAICNKWIGHDEDFSNKIDSILSFWRKYTWREPEGGMAWWYEWRPVPSQAKAQDIGHACNLEIADLYWLSRLGYPVTEQDFRDIVKGIEDHCEFDGTGVMSYRIDGSYKFPGDSVANPAYTLSVAQNIWPVAALAPSLSNLARRAARVGLGSKTSFNWWGDLGVAAFDIAAEAGRLDIASPGK